MDTLAEPLAAEGNIIRRSPERNTMNNCCKKSFTDWVCCSVLPLIVAAAVGAVCGMAIVKREQDRCCNKIMPSVSCCSKCTCLKCEQVSK